MRLLEPLAVRDRLVRTVSYNRTSAREQMEWCHSRSLYILTVVIGKALFSVLP
jgi:hypothetical protein